MQIFMMTICVLQFVKLEHISFTLFASAISHAT